jgi:hypothetical protein
MRARRGSTIVAVGILAVLLGVLRADVGQVQGAANPSAGGLPSLELQVTAMDKALLAKVSTLEFRVRELENQVFGLSQFISVDYGVINGLKGPHVLITGANVHIRSGSGDTVDTTNLGNLIVGYNEPRLQAEPTQGPTRTGSHNFIVGQEHDYTASGGLVAGTGNTISGVFASVSGGTGNTASGGWASVSGGGANTASGMGASVAGGGGNTANGPGASISGGSSNIAAGILASVPGEAFIGPAVSPGSPVGLGLFGVPAVIAKGTLPAGDWLLVSLGLFARANVGGFPVCALHDQANPPNVFDVNNSISIAGSAVRVDLVGTASVTSATEVILDCSAAQGGSANGTFAAVRINNLQPLP